MAVVLGACSSGDRDAAGSLSLDLTLADGLEIDEVDWEITGGDMEPMSGTIDTGAPGATASVEVFGIPPGDDYLISMEATATEGEATCKGSAAFDIGVGEVTEVHVMLNCERPVRFGSVRVNGWLNHCAELVKVVVSPLQTSVGNAIDLFSEAVDDEGDAITYMWSGSGGTIANPKAASTTFTCGQAGLQQVRIVVSDDDFAHCMSDWTVAITCVPIDAGCLADADCNDGNECTANICQPDGSCMQTPITGAGCESGDGTCDASGVCQPNNGCSVDGDCPNTPAPPADPSCTAALCDRSGFANRCVVDLAAAEDVTCDFSGPGSADGMCTSSGECIEAESLCAGVECSDVSACEVRRCNEQTGACERSNVPDGTDCSAENPPLAECQGGVCSGLGCTNDLVCDDGDPCTMNLCDVGTGICTAITLEEGARCVLPGVPFAECIDGECTESACTSDAQCDPSRQCTLRGVCDLETGACAPSVPVENGDPCERFSGATGVCINGLCGCIDDSACSSGSDCIAPRFCELETGVCRGGGANNDGGPCDYRGLGPESGRCDGIFCDPVCFVAPCPDNGVECVKDICDPTDGSCDPVNEVSGKLCDFDAQYVGTCDGAGKCVFACASDADCDDGNACTTDACSLGTGLCSNDGAPNEGGLCTVPGCPAGPTGEGMCTAGACLPNSVCLFGVACPNTPPPPADPQCTAGICTRAGADCPTFCDIDLRANSGGACDGSAPGARDGVCTFNGECFFEEVGCSLKSAIVTVGCTNSVTANQSPFPFVLEVSNVPPITGGAVFTADFDGVGVFPEFFLDGAQGVVPGGVTTAELVDIVATVQVRSGATGPDVPLAADTSSLVPGEVLTCDIPAGQVCLVDLDCADGFGACNVPRVLAALPTSDDCTVGGVCDLLGKGNDTLPPGTQCSNNGFCVTGDLIIDLLASRDNPFTAAASGTVLFGWADGLGAGTTPVPGLALCPAEGRCANAWMPDGCYDLPAAVSANPTAPIGIRVNASGLFVPIQCAQATQGGICASGEGCIVNSADCATPPCTFATDVVCPTPDADLIACPIE